MGWSYCGTDEDGRDIGYGISAVCDHPGCEKEIDRGLSYVCGDEHHGYFNDDEPVCYQGCGKYFCGDHQKMWWGPESNHEVCIACENRLNKEMTEKGDIDCLEKEDREELAKMGTDYV